MSALFFLGVLLRVLHHRQPTAPSRVSWHENTKPTDIILRVGPVTYLINILLIRCGNLLFRLFWGVVGFL